MVNFEINLFHKFLKKTNYNLIFNKLKIKFINH